jgi:hypothetical protein
VREFVRPIWGWAAGGYCAVATYDGVSSQLNLPTISSIWGSSRQLLPLWGWIAIAQTIALAWIYKIALERTSRSPGVALSNEIESLSKRLKTSQDHIQQILTWQDRVSEQVEAIPLLTKQVGPIADSMASIQADIENINSDVTGLRQADELTQGKIEELSDAIGGYGERLRATIRVAMPIDVGAVLENIASRMDQLSVEAYCGTFHTPIDTNIEPSPYATFAFDALAQVACDLVMVVPGLLELLDIPNGHGRSLFIPKDEGYLVYQAPDEIRRTRGYAAVQRRYVHFQIREFLRCGRGQ